MSKHSGGDNEFQALHFLAAGRVSPVSESPKLVAVDTGASVSQCVCKEDKEAGWLLRSEDFPTDFGWFARFVGFFIATPSWLNAHARKTKSLLGGCVLHAPPLYMQNQRDFAAGASKEWGTLSYTATVPSKESKGVANRMVWSAPTPRSCQ